MYIAIFGLRWPLHGNSLRRPSGGPPGRAAQHTFGARAQHAPPAYKEPCLQIRQLAVSSTDNVVDIQLICKLRSTSASRVLYEVRLKVMVLLQVIPGTSSVDGSLTRRATISSPRIQKKIISESKQRKMFLPTFTFVLRSF